MDTFETSIFINRSQKEVFDFFIDPANDHKWQEDVVSSEATSDGPFGVGSTAKSVRNFMGQKLESTIEITAYDPPKSAAFKSTGGPLPFEFLAKFEDQDGGTFVTMTGQAEFGGFLKLASGIALKQAEKAMKKDFEALKALLEG